MTLQDKINFIKEEYTKFVPLKNEDGTYQWSLPHPLKAEVQFTSSTHIIYYQYLVEIVAACLDRANDIGVLDDVVLILSSTLTFPVPYYIFSGYYIYYGLYNAFLREAIRYLIDIYIGNINMVLDEVTENETLRLIEFTKNSYFITTNLLDDFRALLDSLVILLWKETWPKKKDFFVYGSAGVVTEPRLSTLPRPLSESVLNLFEEDHVWSEFHWTKSSEYTEWAITHQSTLNLKLGGNKLTINGSSVSKRKKEDAPYNYEGGAYTKTSAGIWIKSRIDHSTRQNYLLKVIDRNTVGFPIHAQSNLEVEGVWIVPDDPTIDYHSGKNYVVPGIKYPRFPKTDYAYVTLDYPLPDLDFSLTSTKVVSDFSYKDSFKYPIMPTARLQWEGSAKVNIIEDGGNDVTGSSANYLILVGIHTSRGNLVLGFYKSDEWRWMWNSWYDEYAPFSGRVNYWYPLDKFSNFYQNLYSIYSPNSYFHGVTIYVIVASCAWSLKSTLTEKVIYWNESVSVELTMRNLRISTGPAE